MQTFIKTFLNKIYLFIVPIVKSKGDKFSQDKSFDSCCILYMQEKLQNHIVLYVLSYFTFCFIYFLSVLFFWIRFIWSVNPCCWNKTSICNNKNYYTQYIILLTLLFALQNILYQFLFLPKWTFILLSFQYSIQLLFHNFKTGVFINSIDRFKGSFNYLK